MNKLQINLDKKIIEFVKENTKEEVNIQKYVDDILKIALKKNDIYIDTIYISIQSATKDEIKRLNKEYRNIDRATDVLSFPVFDRDELDSIKRADEDKKFKEIELGDIILCLDVVKEQAKMYETGIVRETLYMITHGVCHLLGYDHIEDDDKKEMRELEEDILEKIGVLKNK